MKKLLFIAVMSFISIGAFANESSDGNFEKSKLAPSITNVNELNSKVQQDVITLKRFPITFETSCGTWTGTASCGSLSVTECGTFLNDVGDFLESLC